ncbi:OmpA family protein [Archangium sp.]|uniref:OmpA family protein n=1 Tax=Archangium sp. TaxID=1872627 RepID=UPI002ED82DE1
MDSPLKLTLLMALLCANTALAAEPASAEQVRAELDRQLQAMVDSTPPEVQLHFMGLEDSSAYKLVEVHFTLDGEPLQVPTEDALSAPGPHVLASRQVAEGPHTLVSNVVYMDASWSLFSQTSGFLWNMTSTLNFQAQRGLKVHVKALSVLVPNAKDPRLKVKLVHDVTAEMTAKLDDGSMPEPLSKHSTPPDAGVVVAQSTPPPEPPKTTPRVPEPLPLPAAQPQKARLLVRATVKRKPVEATLSLRGATAPQRIALNRGAKAPAQVEVAPGDYTVDLIAAGYLAQTRRVQLSGGNATSLDFALVRAPKKKLVKESNDRLELQQPLRFPEGQAAPKPASLGFIPELVDILVQRPIQRIRIEAHTDNKEGEEGTRKQLSEARARAVAELLVRAGLEPARIETAGFGDTRPKAPNFTPGGRELNRRVEFIILER